MRRILLLLTASFVGCAENGLVSPPLEVLDPSLNASVSGSLVPGYYMVWETQQQFHLPAGECDADYEFTESGLMAYTVGIASAHCTQYTFGTFLILPRSGETDPEPITVEGTGTFEATGPGTGCASIVAIRPWNWIMEDCGPARSRVYQLDLMTNTKYRIETIAQAHADGVEIRSRLTLNLSGPTPAATRVAIDVKPGSESNTWNCRSHGVLPVAVLSDADFDATTIAIEAVTFGRNGDEAAEVHARAHEEDVNQDGRSDVVLHFASEDIGFSCADVVPGERATDFVANLTGATTDGELIHGVDEIRLIGWSRR